MLDKEISYHWDLLESRDAPKSNQLQIEEWQLSRKQLASSRYCTNKVSMHNIPLSRAAYLGGKDLISFSFSISTNFISKSISMPSRAYRYSEIGRAHV